MQIVIDIPQKVYDKALSGDGTGTIWAGYVKNGTPLPRHHGRLIDYDDLIEKLDRYGRGNVKYQLPYSPTIIEKDGD